MLREKRFRYGYQADMDRPNVEKTQERWMADERGCGGNRGLGARHQTRARVRHVRASFSSEVH